MWNTTPRSAMSPEGQVSMRVVEWGVYASIGLVSILLTILAWFGKRQVQTWEGRLDGLEEQLDDLEAQMHDDHHGVEDGVGGLREEIHALRQDIRRE